MTREQWIVAALVRLYPAAWRAEYGLELTDLLLARPLGPRVIADTAWNGLRLRGRAAEPSTILGLLSMLAMLTGLAVSGGRYGGDAWAVLRPSSMTFPTITVTFLTSELYVLLLGVCGCWTHLRHGGKVTRAGVAAMRMSLIAGIPIMLMGLLMAFGFLDVIMLDSRGGAPMRPFAWAIVAAPLARVPEAWIWGSFGGLLGKRISRRRRSTPLEG
jgi:hypothetical protein